MPAAAKHRRNWSTFGSGQSTMKKNMCKKAIGVASVVFACSMLLIEPSMATCFETNYKFEHGNREQVIQAIMDYGKCVKAENKSQVGKYFCHTDNMVGISSDPRNGQTIESGNQKPSVDTFYVTISEIDDHMKRIACDYGELGVGNNFGDTQNQCLANYHIDFSDGTSGGVPNSVDGYVFYNEFSNFILFGTNTFMWAHMGGWSTIMKGRCEKVN
jgi:hypothetical protein